MNGTGDHDYVVLRIEQFTEQVLRPAIHPLRAPLEVGIFQTDEPVPLVAAMAADYRPVRIGHRWGPAWSTAWFRLRGEVPPLLAGQDVALRFSSGTEALLWLDGTPCRGFDDNRDTCVLFPAAQGDEQVELFVEAACNHPFGISTFYWDPPEVHHRWRDAEPGRLETAELVAVDTDLQRICVKLDFARQLALELPADSARAHQLVRGLRTLLSGVPAAEPLRIKDLEPEVDELLGGDRRHDSVCVAVGHAHLDTAWLWPLGETRRKLQRSWSNVLELMELDPDFRFVGSQAQQYAWVCEDSPELFARIAERVAEGRWEPGGGMWIEPDCNAPSGESLVRQLLLGTGAWQSWFGDRGAQRHLFLPDTFGFPASLPQIMTLGGLDTFVTNKLSWSDRNEFPHTTFRWRGIDGTEVLTHFTPGGDYNAQLLPKELLRGERKLVRTDLREAQQSRAASTTWLQPFGFGDGGGGPTVEMLHRARAAARCAGAPRVRFGRIDEFCAALHDERAELRQRTGRDLPVWDDELYLELHRGTLTTAAWLKRANARAEERLRTVEALLAGLADPALHNTWTPRLAAAWRTVLLHQFHDILPGSSIPPVYDDAQVAFGELDDDLETGLDVTLSALADRLPTAGLAHPIGVFNPGSAPRDGVIEIDGNARLVRAVPALGARVFERDAPGADDATPVTTSTTPHRLSNGLVELTLDDAGRIATLGRPGAISPVHRDDAPLNQLVLYEDRPRRWDAWDIDFDHTDKATPLDQPADVISVLRDGPVRGVIEVERNFGRSRIVQRYVLDAGCPFVRIDSEIDWQERHTLLRALFPTRIRARRATFGIQFGHLERPTHRNTSWDEARFEVPGQRWMDLSQAGLGLAILDHVCHGRSALDDTLGLSLLRSPMWPCPDIDRREHRCSYALLPHDGDWRAAGVPARADELAEPLLVMSLPADATASAPSPDATRPDTWTPFTLHPRDPGSVQIAACKIAEDGDGVIVRLVERHGGDQPIELRWPTPPRAVTPVDLLERPLPSREPPIVDATVARTELRPFEILSLRITS